ncbi:MAG: hypothetical protein RIR18_1070 [Pseudomonadota bacterium]
MSTPDSSGNTSSFTLSGTNDLDAILNGDKLKWGDTSGTPVVTYSFPQTGAVWGSGYSDEVTSANFAPLSSEYSDEIAAALHAWSDVANISFQPVSETSESVGDIRIAYSYAVGDSSWGYAWYPSGSPWAGDVWMNRKTVLDESHATFAPGSIDFENLIHEFGHAIGLKHPGNYNAGGGGAEGPYITQMLDKVNYTIMSYTEADWKDANGDAVFPRTPGVYDVRAIQYLYGANTTTNLGDTTYTLSASGLLGETLWDAGGTDTINASSFTTPVQIDLTDGHYSSVGLENNIGIAFNAVIEGAVGGSGDDTLIGNNVSNSLTGGAGNDKFMFNTALNGTSNVDTITDFVSGADKLYLSGDIFAAISGGSSGLSQSFVSSAVATALTDRLLYDASTGYLSYDPDGSGASPAVRFALLSGSSTLLASDIKVVGGGSAPAGKASPPAAKIYDGEIQSGGSTTDTVEGGTGDDELSGEGGNDSLEAGEGDDYLDGGDGNDSLDGGAGDDVVSGGAGNDVAHSGDGSDEVYGDAGNDTLFLEDGDDYAEGGDGNDVVTGGLGDDLIYGGAGNDKIDGGEGNDELGGDDGVDQLTGGLGDDTLDGGAGSDKMTGGLGDDVYYVDVAKEGVTEKPNEGDDSVVSSVSYILGANVENLFLYGSSGLTGTGNKLDNYLGGTEEADTLNGKEGFDVLEGGLGDDIFVFDTKLSETTNVDEIADFVSGQDKIYLSKKIFAKIAAGALSESDLLVTTLGENAVVASGGSAHFIYDQATGNLYFDKDAAGSATAVKFATLMGLPSLEAADLMIV